MLYPYFVTGADLEGGRGWVAGVAGVKVWTLLPTPLHRDHSGIRPLAEPKGPPCTILRYPFLAD